MLFPLKPLWIDLLRDKVTPCPSPFIPQHILVLLGLFSPHPLVDIDIGNINIDISIYWYWHYNPLGVGEYWYCSRHPLVKILILAILTIHSYPFLNSLSLEPAPEPALAKNISLLPNNAHSDYFFYISSHVARPGIMHSRPMAVRGPWVSPWASVGPPPIKGLLSPGWAAAPREPSNKFSSRGTGHFCHMGCRPNSYLLQ